jgi:hypothetical protein
MLARICSSGIWVEILILLNNNSLFVLGFTEPGYDKTASRVDIDRSINIAIARHTLDSVRDAH